MAEVCGDKELLRTASGLTIDEPCKGLAGIQVYCNLPDYKDWQRRVEDLYEMQTVTWNKLYDVEATAPQRTHTANGSNLRMWWDRVDVRIKAIPDLAFYQIGDSAADAIADMGGIVQDQACLIATMRKYIVEAGETPPPLPHVKPEPRLELDDVFRDQARTLREQTPKIITGLLLIGGLVAVAYVLRPAIMTAAASRRMPALPRPKAGGKR